MRRSGHPERQALTLGQHAGQLFCMGGKLIPTLVAVNLSPLVIASFLSGNEEAQETQAWVAPMQLMLLIPPFKIFAVMISMYSHPENQTDAAKKRIYCAGRAVAFIMSVATFALRMAAGAVIPTYHLCTLEEWDVVNRYLYWLTLPFFTEYINKCNLNIMIQHEDAFSNLLMICRQVAMCVMVYCLFQRYDRSSAACIESIAQSFAAISALNMVVSSVYLRLRKKYKPFHDVIFQLRMDQLDSGRVKTIFIQGRWEWLRMVMDLGASMWGAMKLKQADTGVGLIAYFALNSVSMLLTSIGMVNEFVLSKYVALYPNSRERKKLIFASVGMMTIAFVGVGFVMSNKVVSHWVYSKLLAAHTNTTVDVMERIDDGSGIMMLVYTYCLSLKISMAGVLRGEKKNAVASLASLWMVLIVPLMMSLFNPKLSGYFESFSIANLLASFSMFFYRFSTEACGKRGEIESPHRHYAALEGGGIDSKSEGGVTIEERHRDARVDHLNRGNDRRRPHSFSDQSVFQSQGVVVSQDLLDQKEGRLIPVVAR